MCTQFEVLEIQIGMHYNTNICRSVGANNHFTVGRSEFSVTPIDYFG